MSCYKAFIQYLGLYLALKVSCLIIPVVSSPIQVPLPLRSINNDINNSNNLEIVGNKVALSRVTRQSRDYSRFSSRRAPRTIHNRLMRSHISFNLDSLEGPEAIVEFKHTVTAFQNVTRAILNLTVYSDPDLNTPFTLVAGVTYATTIELSQIEFLYNLGSSVLLPGKNSVAFDVLDFYRNINSSGISSDSSTSGTPNTSAKLRIFYKINRGCNKTVRSTCPQILNTSTRIPFLTCNYGNSLKEINNVDAMLALAAVY